MPRLLAALAAAALAAFGAATPLPCSAGIEPTPFVDWSRGLSLQGSSPLGDDPRVIFGFNPQPDPPREYTQRVDLSDGARVTHSGNFEFGDAFDLFVAIALGGTPLQLARPGPFEGAMKSISLGVSSATGGHLFDLVFEFESSSGGVLDAASAVAFNPQPDPPAEFGGDAAFGLSFGFTSFSDVSVTLRLLDAQGNPLVLQRVPAPAAWSLVLLAALWLFGPGRRRPVPREQRPQPVC